MAHVAQSVERFLGKEEVHQFDSGRGLQNNNQVKSFMELELLNLVPSIIII